ncbi:MAG: tetratricopeptide repeat protein [Euryarchaeota archaeon]|jgi:tetratricopeptide (TPR) repeat protein|nr:tetratricopeptide repeat protein [Euryarchaeota archaeon]
MTRREVKMYYDQALSFLGQGEAQKSVEFLDRALEIDDKYFPAWNNKGIALLELGKFQDALKCFEQVIQLNSLDKMAWYNKGYTLLILERYGESVDAFDIFLARYTQEDHFYKYALYLQAKAHYFLKNYQTAVDLLRRAIETDPDFEEAHDLLNSISNNI